jgi:hypothetical protein
MFKVINKTKLSVKFIYALCQPRMLHGFFSRRTLSGIDLKKPSYEVKEIGIITFCPSFKSGLFGNKNVDLHIRVIASSLLFRFRLVSF